MFLFVCSIGYSLEFQSACWIPSNRLLKLSTRSSLSHVNFIPTVFVVSGVSLSTEVIPAFLFELIIWSVTLVLSSLIYNDKGLIMISRSYDLLKARICVYQVLWYSFCLTKSSCSLSIQQTDSLVGKSGRSLYTFTQPIVLRLLVFSKGNVKVFKLLNFY